MGIPFRLRKTSQTPYYQIRALHLFQDGREIKSTGIRVDQDGAADKVFQLCLALDRDPSVFLDFDQELRATTPELSGWSALGMKLEAHIKARGSTVYEDYRRHIKSLSGLRGPVTMARLQKWVEEPRPDQRDRERRIVTAERLVEMGINLDPNWLTKIKSLTTYEQSKVVDPRTLPTDDQLVEFIDRMPNRAWQVGLGYMATYGLRPHEIFRIEARPDREGWIEISRDSKTGWRAVMPAHPEWIDRWNLWAGGVPDHNSDMSLKDLGRKVTQHVKRYRHLATWPDPKAYSLRHAYAARLHTHEDYEELETRDTAKLMGHSEKEHKNVYLRWVDKDQLKRSMKRRLRSRQ